MKRVVPADEPSMPLDLAPAEILFLSWETLEGAEQSSSTSYATTSSKKEVALLDAHGPAFDDAIPVASPAAAARAARRQLDLLACLDKFVEREQVYPM